MISITENEGNARLTTSLPRIHVALMGIEKMVRRMDDLALFLPMLATAGAGQASDLLQHALRRAAPARAKPTARSSSTSCCSTTAAPPAGRCRAARLAPLHPLRRLPERLPHLPQRRRPHLRHGLSAGRSARSSRRTCAGCRSGSTSRSPPRCAAPAPQACPVKIDLAHHLLQNRRNAVKARAAVLRGPAVARLLLHHAPPRPLSPRRQAGTRLSAPARPDQRLRA